MPRPFKTEFGSTKIYPTDLHAGGLNIEQLESINDPSQAGISAYPDYVDISIVKSNGANLQDFKKKLPDKLRNAIANNKTLSKTSQGRIAQARALDAIARNPDKPFNQVFDIVATQFSRTVSNVADTGEFSRQINQANEELAGDILSGLTTAFRGSKKFEGENVTRKSIGNIHLPMPDNVTYNEQVEWQATDLGAIGGLAKNEAPKDGLGAAGFAQLGSIISGGAGALVSSVLGAGITGGAVLGVLGGGNVLQGTLESQLKIKSNPFKEQTFQGVPFRPFEFSWTFAPRSQTEVDTIKEIITFLREYTKPNYRGGSSKFFFEYPHEVDIRFKTRRIQGNRHILNPYLPKLKPCICKSINTNFATAGWHSFEDGAPTSITLQIQFEEIEIVTADDVRKDY